MKPRFVKGKTLRLTGAEYSIPRLTADFLMKGMFLFWHQFYKNNRIEPRFRSLFLMFVILSLVLGHGFIEDISNSIAGASTDLTSMDNVMQNFLNQDKSENLEMENLQNKNTTTEQINIDEDSFDMPVFMEENPFFSWKDIQHRLENPIFTEGEILTYRVSWMGINAGTITMKLDAQSDYDGKAVYKVIVTGETNKTFSTFFKVRDVFTSIMDPETFNSIYYSKNVREGKYRKFQETRYDQGRRKAWTGDHEHDLPPNSKDPIACVYAMRRFKPGDNTVVRMNSNSEGKSNYPVEITFSSTTPLSLADNISRRVLQGRPLPTWEGRMFEKRRSEVVFWLSDETIAVPLKLQIKVRIGSLHADLIGRTGPGWELNLEK